MLGSPKVLREAHGATNVTLLINTLVQLLVMLVSIKLGTVHVDGGHPPKQEEA